MADMGNMQVTQNLHSNSTFEGIQLLPAEDDLFPGRISLIIIVLDDWHLGFLQDPQKAQPSDPYRRKYRYFPYQFSSLMPQAASEMSQISVHQVLHCQETLISPLTSVLETLLKGFEMNGTYLLPLLLGDNRYETQHAHYLQMIPSSSKYSRPFKKKFFFNLQGG